MATEFVRSQGTEIFILPDPDALEPMRLSCPTAVTRSGGALNMTEVLCLDAQDPEYVAGSRSPTTWSIPFALVDTDLTHQEVYALAKLGEAVPFIVALSGSTEEPTVVGGDLVPPTTRSSFHFMGIVMEVGFEANPNDVVRGTITVQVSGPITDTWRTA